MAVQPDAAAAEVPQVDVVAASGAGHQTIAHEAPVKVAAFDITTGLMPPVGNWATQSFRPLAPRITSLNTSSLGQGPKPKAGSLLVTPSRSRPST
jgi:hypothetical protein